MESTDLSRRVIAENILYQLGGSSLLTVTIQARNFKIGSNGSVTFRFSGFRGANRVRIYLSDYDTYDMEFSYHHIRTDTITVRRTYKYIHMDKMKEVFEQYIKRKIQL
jgi:hypothetical protein